MGMIYAVELEGRSVSLEVERTETGWRVREHGEDSTDDWRDVPGRFLVDGDLLLSGERQRRIGVHVDGDRVSLQARGHGLSGTVIDPRTAAADLTAGGAEGVIQSPMPGVVVRCPVAVGDSVSAGQVVIVVEAMKMENEFKAQTDGIVAELPIPVGNTLEANTVLARIDPIA